MSQETTPADRLRVVAGVALFAALALLLLWRAWDGSAGRAADAARSREASFSHERTDVPAPPFELDGLDGAKVRLSDLRGQVVFVNFWATWCPPCRDEMPSMVALGKDLAARHPGKFRMVAVSVDDGPNPIREFFAAPPFGGIAGTGLTVAMDQEQAVAKDYYCRGRGECSELKFPETYIVDASGRLVAYMVGPRDWSNPAARALLERIIAAQGS